MPIWFIFSVTLISDSFSPSKWCNLFLSASKAFLEASSFLHRDSSFCNISYNKSKSIKTMSLTTDGDQSNTVNMFFVGKLSDTFSFLFSFSVLTKVFLAECKASSLEELLDSRSSRCLLVSPNRFVKWRSSRSRRWRFSSYQMCIYDFSDENKQEFMDWIA